MKRSANRIVAILFSVWSCMVFASDAPLLLEYQREFSLMQEVDNSVDVQIFSDGTVLVHYPIYMTRAGDYRFELGTSELEQLLNELRELGLDSFDEVAARRDLMQAQNAALEAAQSGSGSMRIITDPEISRLRMAPSMVQSSSGEERAYSFTGVRSQSQIYPQLTAISELSTALDLLDRLTTDSRMERIEVAQ